MGMDGVETLDALQWIAELLALGIGVFFAICFVAGFIAGPDKIKPTPIIPEQIEIGYISEPKGVQPSARSTPSSVMAVDDIKMEADKIKRLRNKVQRLKLEKQLRELKEPEPILGGSSKTTLMSDCVSSLIALGEKPADAKKLVKSYLSSHPDTSSVDEFITGVYSS